MTENLDKTLVGFIIGGVITYFIAQSVIAGKAKAVINPDSHEGVDNKNGPESDTTTDGTYGLDPNGNPITAGPT